MPRMNNHESIAATQLAKLLIIGDGKIGKTHYAGMAAAAGFNVLYMDGDVGAQTLATLPEKARERIFLMSTGDKMLGNSSTPDFAQIVLTMADSVRYLWNDTQARKAKVDDDESDEVWEIKLGELNQNWIWVIDSWTSLTESFMLQAAQSHTVDLAHASTSELRPVYQSAALKATAALKLIRSARCHVICIAHPDEYSHLSRPEGRKVKDIKETDMTVDWTKRIPKSTSKPHGLLLPKYFTDVAWAQTNRMGNEFQLNFKLHEDRVSGGHFKEVKSQEEYSFVNLVKQIGGAVPDGNENMEGLRITTAGEIKDATSAKVLDGSGNKTVKGIAGLGRKK